MSVILTVTALYVFWWMLDALPVRNEIGKVVDPNNRGRRQPSSNYRRTAPAVCYPAPLGAGSSMFVELQEAHFLGGSFTHQKLDDKGPVRF